MSRRIPKRKACNIMKCPYCKKKVKSRTLTYCTSCGRRLPAKPKMKWWKKALLYLFSLLLIGAAGYVGYDQLSARKAIDRLAAQWEEGRIQDLMGTGSYQTDDPEQQEKISRLEEKYGIGTGKPFAEGSILDQLLQQTEIEIEKPNWIGRHIETTAQITGPDMGRILEETAMMAEITGRLSGGNYDQRTVSVPVTIHREGSRVYADPSSEMLQAFYGGMMEKYASLYDTMMDEFFSRTEQEGE